MIWAVLLTALFVIVFALVFDEWDRARPKPLPDTRRRNAMRAVARELVAINADVLVTPRDVEIPLDLLNGDFALEDALEILDSVEALG